MTNWEPPRPAPPLTRQGKIALAWIIVCAFALGLVVWIGQTYG